MSKNWYSFTDELTSSDEHFFTLVENCDVAAIESYMVANRVNLNMKNYQAITPLHLAIQNDCEPLVELLLSQDGKYLLELTYSRILSDKNPKNSKQQIVDCLCHMFYRE